jgi:hypothetical protein
LESAYRSVSPALNRALALGGWPKGRVPKEVEITEALADVLDHSCHGDTATVLAMQRVMLARCQKPVRDYYRNKPLQVWRLEAGPRLAPDLVLDGRPHQPAAPLADVFMVELLGRPPSQAARHEPIHCIGRTA